MKKIYSFLLMAAMLLIGGNAWATERTAADQAAFVQVCSEAASGDVITLNEGTFAIGPVDINGKTITFKGQGASKTTVYIGNGGYDGNGGHGSSKTANMTFENLTLDDLASDAGYLTGFTEAAGLTFRNVTFNTGFSNWGNKGGAVSFYNCTFKQTITDKYNVQELRSASGTVFTFDACTFISEGGRFINAYKQGGASAKITINVKDCSFTGTAQSKAALNLKSGYGDGCNIALNLEGNNIVSNVKAGSKTGVALFDDNDTHAVVIVNGVTIWSEGRTLVAEIASEPVVNQVTPSAEVLTNAGAENDEQVVIVETVLANGACSEVDGLSNGSYLHIQLKNVEFAEVAEGEETYVSEMVFDVKPMVLNIDGTSSVIANSAITSPITFRLPVDASATETLAEVFHNGESMGADYQVQGTTEKFIEVSSTSFSKFGYKLLAAPAGPDFTQTEIVITTPAELVAFAAYVNAGHNMAGQTVKLDNDIDMTGVEFTPISQSANWFAGVFDGQGKTIKNLTVNTPSTNRAALFGGLNHGAIKNFTLDNPQIQGGADYTAAVCASGNGTIDNVTVKGGSVKGKDQVGGIAGFMIATTIKHCTLENTTVEATGDRAGGIIGKIDGQNSFHIDNNTLINVTVKAAAKHGVCGAGGIASQLMTNTVASGMSIKNNEIQVTTITAGVEEFVPIANLRDGYSIDPVNETNICKNHWVPETVTSTTISNGTSSVTFGNFVPVAKIGDEGYATLADAFAAVPANNTLTTIELLADCAGSGIVVSAGQNVTVNFNNHTYTVNQAPLAGSAGTKNQCFQLLKGATVVFNDGTIVADNTDVKMIIQNYADLTLNNMVLDATVGTNNCKYVLSTNNGETKIIDTEITAKDGEVAFDVCGGWGGYESNVVTVSGSSEITGTIEISQYNETATESLTFAGGNFTNAVIVVDQSHGGEQVTVTKAADAEVTAPEGYKWENNTLVPDLTTVRTGLASGLLAGLCEKKQIVRVEGATLYDIEYFDGFYVHFIEHVGPVAAGQPVIYQADGGDIKVQLVGEDADEAGHNNGLYGTFSAMTAGSLTGYYAMVNNQVRLLGEGATMGAGKAYIVLDEISTEQSANAPLGARRFVVGAEQVTTGMENVVEAGVATKVVVDGELYIIRGGQMFNAAGQIVK